MQMEPETVETLNHLVALERDMIAALLAARNRLPGGERSNLDLLLTEHADRLPVLERQVRERGGLPPDPGQRPGVLPRDASDIARVSDLREAVRALADDHNALAEAYRVALAIPSDDDDARRTLEIYFSEMEQHSARLAALLPAM
jgi:hypothetical protein